MRRSLIASALLHAAAFAIAVVIGAVGPRRVPLPPVYRVDLVSARELERKPEPPRPDPVEEVEPEPEPVEEIPSEREAPLPAEETPAPRTEVAPDPGPTLPVATEGAPFEFPWYLQALVRKVQRNWSPPAGSALKTTIHFRIDRLGRLADVDVEEGSGNFLFDQAAVRAIEASDPMPPLPEQYSGDYLGVFFDFDTQVETSR